MDMTTTRNSITETAQQGAAPTGLRATRTAQLSEGASSPVVAGQPGNKSAAASSAVAARREEGDVVLLFYVYFSHPLPSGVERLVGFIAAGGLLSFCCSLRFDRGFGRGGVTGRYRSV